MPDLNIDQIAYKAVFGEGEAKAGARRTIHLEARARGAVSSSIYPLYMAIGRGEAARRFTVPAFNIRALTYDAARALFRAAKRHDVGAFIFEIARSEIGYTEQRPHEYAAGILADGQVWIDMLDHRNLLAHNYDGVVLVEVTDALAARYFPAMEQLREFLAAPAPETTQTSIG
jgi:hypothetical protein